MLSSFFREADTFKRKSKLCLALPKGSKWALIILSWGEYAIESNQKQEVGGGVTFLPRQRQGVNPPEGSHSQAWDHHQ